LFFSKIHHGLDTALHWRSGLNHGGWRTALRAHFDARTASTVSFLYPGFSRIVPAVLGVVGGHAFAAPEHWSARGA